MSMQMNFKDKIVIITGATRGIGENMAKNLHDMGATLLLTGTNRHKIETMNKKLSKNEHIKYFHLDLLDDKSIMRFLSILRTYDKIDACINNAGINRINYIYETKIDDWEEIIKVNLRGPFLLSKEVGNIMKKRKCGRIVNIASIFGVITKEKRAAYTAAKAGLIGLTKTTAIDLAKYNVLVNSVSPGFIMTDLTRKILTEKEIDNLKTLIPVRRLGAPEDISSVVMFLISDLNTYITGQNIIVDGGYVDI